MFRLMNQDIVKSEYEARKDTSAESPLVQYKSRAADGCQQCQKLENAFNETQKKLERTQRQLTKANDYNEDLRKQIHWLSSELHEIRSKSKNKSDVGTQVELAETNDVDYKSSPCLKEEKKKSEDNKQARDDHLEDTAKPSHDEDDVGGNLSIAEELKQAAEEAVEETGYVYDQASGLYYDKNSGYYYNPETALHYDSNTGTYYTYDSVSGTYIFHSQVDASYLQHSHGDPTSTNYTAPNSYQGDTTTANYPSYTAPNSYQGDTTPTNYPSYTAHNGYQGDTTTGSYQGYPEADAQNYEDSFQEYRDPSNTTNTPSKKSKKRKNKAKKEKNPKAQKVDNNEKSELVVRVSGESVKAQESEVQKGEAGMEEEEGEILPEAEDSVGYPMGRETGAGDSNMEVSEDSKSESNKLQINHTELQGLNRKQRREKIRQMRRTFEDESKQSGGEPCQKIERVVKSSEIVKQVDKDCSNVISVQEQEMIETGYSVYSCDELCSLSKSSIEMEETSTNSFLLISDESLVTKTFSCSSQVNSSQGSISSCATTSSELSKTDVTKVKHKESSDISPACKDCGKSNCKIHSLQEETLYPGNLSDDTQNAVDFDFVIKVKHENCEDCKQSNTTDLGTATRMEDDCKKTNTTDIGTGANMEECVKENSQSMEDDSTLKCPTSVDKQCSTLETAGSSQPEVMCDKIQTLNHKRACDNRSDGEDSWSVCTNESELESGELTESSEESESSSEDDTEMIQESGEDQDPYSFPPCVRLIVTDSDYLDYGSLFIITCDGGTIGREKYLGNVIIIPDINISKIHAQLKYMSDTGRYYVMDYGSQNGTFLNEERISESKCSSTYLPVNHGDCLQIGCTRFLLHIHPGTETCDECEPGQVKAAYQATQTKDIQILSKEEKKKQARQELNQIKKKYGLKNAAYTDNSEVIKNPNYQDRAEERRKTKGSDNPYQVDEAPASVHRPITEGNVGHKLLKKMGWSEGESLGKDNTGIQDPVCVSFRMNQKAGLGSEAACSKSLDDVGEVDKNKRWLEAQQRYRKAIADKQIPTPAWVKESKLKPSDFK